METRADRPTSDLAERGGTIRRMSASTQPATAAAVQLPATRFAALQSRNFRLLWFGLLASNAGTWMASTGEGWLVTDLEPERAAFWLGAISLTFAVPMLVLPPIGGAVADRFSRLRLLWIVQTAYLLMSITLAAVVLSGNASVWVLIVYAFGNGVVLAFDSPTRHSLLPDIVTRDQLTSAVSLNSVAFTGASLVGPAIAGGLIPLIGVGGVFAVNAVSCVATLAAIAMFRDLPATTRAAGTHENVVRSIARGFHYVATMPMIAGVMLVSTVSGLFARSYTPLLAVYARDVYHVGSGAYGALIAAGGLGTLIGAFGLASRSDPVRKGRVIGVALIVQASLLVLFAATAHFWTALPILLLVGVLSAISSALISTVIQLTVPNELRGRIMSLYVLTLVGVPSIGSFVLGSFAEVTNPRFAVGAGATIVVCAIAILYALNRELREA